MTVTYQLHRRASQHPSGEAFALVARHYDEVTRLKLIQNRSGWAPGDDSTVGGNTLVFDQLNRAVDKRLPLFGKLLIRGVECRRRNRARGGWIGQRQVSGGNDDMDDLHLGSGQLRDRTRHRQRGERKLGIVDWGDDALDRWVGG